MFFRQCADLSLRLLLNRAEQSVLCWSMIVALAMTAPRASAADDDPPSGELTRLRYNHPGLVVDLGVGLWAWPLPCDADGDGDFDLIVSCPDRPSNGVWFFENVT